MVKKKVCIKQYICTNLFLCFLVREMNSWPLMLILWYAGRRREEPRPPSSLCGTLLCRRGRVWKKQKKLQNKTEKVAGRARHPGRSTFYAVLPVGGVKGQPPGLTAPPSSFQLPQNSFLPSFLLGPVMTLFPPCCGVTGLQRLALAASPVDTVVMSLPPGSTIGHPRPPQWAASLVYSVGEWGGWATAGRWDGVKPSLPVCPSPRPSRGHWLRTS